MKLALPRASGGAGGSPLDAGSIVSFGGISSVCFGIYLLAGSNLGRLFFFVLFASRRFVGGFI